jgi:hypothetical protein
MKIVLHMDVNQTLIPSDDVNGKNALDGILNDAADFVVHGPSGLFMKQYAEQLYPPVVNDVEITKKNKQLRQQFYHDHLMKNATLHQQERILCAMNSVKQHYIHNKENEPQKGLMIVPSFFHLIEWFRRNNFDFVVNLRTFGTDLPQMIPLLKEEFGIELFLIENEMNVTVSYLHQTSNGQHCAIRGDYGVWVKNEKSWKHGKRFPLQLSPGSKENILSIFFDDNVHNGIVCPLVYNKIVGDYEFVEPQKLIGKHIFHVSIVDALYRSEYFIDMVKQSISLFR